MTDRTARATSRRGRRRSQLSNRESANDNGETGDDGHDLVAHCVADPSLGEWISPAITSRRESGANPWLLVSPVTSLPDLVALA